MRRRRTNDTKRDGSCSHCLSVLARRERYHASPTRSSSSCCASPNSASNASREGRGEFSLGGVTLGGVGAAGGHWARRASPILTREA